MIQVEHKPTPAIPLSAAARGPLAWLRAALRIGAAGLGTSGLYAALVASRALPVRARRGARRRLMRAWGRLGLWAFGARLALEGEPPPAPALIVSNHTSYLDILVHAAASGPVFVSMAELARWPVLGRLARSGGTLFLDRERKRELVGVNEGVSAALARGERVVFFPEGRSSDGSGVLPFRPSLFAPAASNGIAVHAAAIDYRTQAPDPPAQSCVPWIDGSPFVPHALRLAGLRRIEVRLRYRSSALRSPDRKALAAGLHAAVVELRRTDPHSPSGRG